EEIGDLEAAQPARGEGALLVVGDQHPSGFAAPEQYGVGQGGEHRLQRWRDRWRRRGAKRRGARTGGGGRAGAGVGAWPSAGRRADRAALARVPRLSTVLPRRVPSRGRTAAIVVGRDGAGLSRAFPPAAGRTPARAGGVRCPVWRPARVLDAAASLVSIVAVRD